MIKKIHLILVGGRRQFSNLEVECIESWKKIYPDFEIKIWTDENCMGWINESSFASYHYHKTKIMAYVSDYLRCKILYEEGGLYMDFDVFAVNRIPDSYFEKSFLAWDICRKTSNNGTCFYASEIHLPIFKEFCEVMENKNPIVEGQTATAMDGINVVLEKYGFSTDLDCEQDYDFGNIMILNRSQFGANYSDKKGYITNNRTVYLTHMCSGSWAVSSFGNVVELKYAVVNDKTDLSVLKKKMRKIASPRKPSNILIIFIAAQFECDDELKEIIASMGNFACFYIIPNNNRGNVIDYITHRVEDIHCCRDLLREDYCG